MNVLSMHALIGAYRPEGYEWADESLCETLTGTWISSSATTSQSISRAHVTKPEGTPEVLFVDCTDWVRRPRQDHSRTWRKLRWAVGAAVQDGDVPLTPAIWCTNLASPSRPH